MRPDQDNIDREAIEFWCAENGKTKSLAHWRGVGDWEDDQRWVAVGIRHLRLLQDLEDRHPVDAISDRPRRVLEWGVGGGCNVVALSRVRDSVGFGPLYDEVYGVDISNATLAECERQLEKSNPNSGVVFVPILIRDPEDVLLRGDLSWDVDLFLCTAVVQHMPSREYVARFLRSALACTGLGGRGLVQFRTPARVAGRRKKNSAVGEGSYLTNVARWCLFRPKEFVELCEFVGWRVLDVVNENDSPVSYFVYLERS